MRSIIYLSLPSLQIDKRVNCKLNSSLNSLNAVQHEHEEGKLHNLVVRCLV
jgi:hypothetical protein